jgi:hypothetical protein
LIYFVEMILLKHMETFLNRDKMTKYFFLLILITLYTACSDNENNEQVRNKTNQLIEYADDGTLKSLSIFDGDTITKKIKFDEKGNITLTLRSYLARKSGNGSFVHLPINYLELFKQDFYDFGNHSVNKPVSFEFCAIPDEDFLIPDFCVLNLYLYHNEDEVEVISVLNIDNLYNYTDTLVDVINGRDTVKQFFIHEDVELYSEAGIYYEESRLLDEMFVVMNHIHRPDELCVKFTLTPLKAGTLGLYPHYYCATKCYRESDITFPNFSIGGFVFNLNIHE